MCLKIVRDCKYEKIHTDKFAYMHYAFLWNTDRIRIGKKG